MTKQTTPKSGTAKHSSSIDWASTNLALSIAIVAASFFHVGLRLLGLALPQSVFASVDPVVRAVAIMVFDYGIPFAVAFLVIKSLDLAGPLRRRQVFSWLLFLCNAALLALMTARLAIGTFGGRDLKEIAGVYFWAYESLVTVPAFLGTLAIWIGTVIALVRQLMREGLAFHLPTPSETALVFFFGAGVPAAALVPLFPGAQKYHERYAQQEARFAEVCKGTKLEILETATPPKSVFIDPDSDTNFWNVHDGRFGPVDQGLFADSLAPVGPLEFTEFWNTWPKVPELKRCNTDGKCETIPAVTAKYRAIAKDIQSKADEKLGLTVHTITVDERETGKIIARLQFAFIWETHRICSPGKEGENFSGRDFIAKALGVKSKWTEAELTGQLAQGKAERDLVAAQRTINFPDERLDPKTDDSDFFNNRCWDRAILNKQLELALADCDRSVSLKKAAANLDTRAVVYYRLARYRDAIADCDAALAIDPKMATALYMRGLSKRRSGDVTGGNKDLAAAEQLRPGIDAEYSTYGLKP